MSLYVILSGTLERGFTVVGPFVHPSFATEWASIWEDDITWEVMPLIDPSAREIPNYKE